MNKKSRPVSQQRSQKTKQKISRQLVIAGSSVFALVVTSIIYLNFSNSKVSKADNAATNDIINYRTTEIVVAKRVIRKASVVATETELTDKTARTNGKIYLGRDVMSPIKTAE